MADYISTSSGGSSTPTYTISTPDVDNGTSDTAFSPDATCTRAQMETFLYRDMAE